jgi:hypothetical protein
MWLVIGIGVMLCAMAGEFVFVGYKFGWAEAGAAGPLIIFFSAPVLGLMMYPFMYMEFGSERCPICGKTNKRQKTDRCRGACKPPES